SPPGHSQASAALLLATPPQSPQVLYTSERPQTWTAKLLMMVILCQIDASLRLYDFPERLPALSGTTPYRQDDPAVVRRLGRGVDRLRAVLPASAAARLPVLALVDSVFEAESAD